MVIYDVSAETVQHLIVCLRSEALHKGIRVTVLTNPVNDVASLIVFKDHVAHCTDIVLSVIIDGYGDIAVFHSLHKTGYNSILMSSVTRKAYSLNVRILRTQFLDRVPGIIAAAVVNEQNAALVADKTFITHLKKLSQKHRTCDLDNFCVFINGYYDIQNCIFHVNDYTIIKVTIK